MTENHSQYTILLKRAAGLLEENDITEIDEQMLSPRATLSLY